MFRFCGTISRNIIRINLGKTKRVFHIGLLMLKPMAVIIKFKPKRYKTLYSQRPMISKNPPISAVYDVNHEALIVKNLGIPLFTKVL